MKTMAWKDHLFFSGIAVGFLLAVVLGREAAAHAKPEKFERFYWSITPESLYYPTYASMEKLALARWSPGKILVIVGGNSILNGAGQPVEELWTHRLQELLGPRYAVVNLSLRGALATEGGALVAEALQRRGIPLIFIANTAPDTCGLPVGSIYGYLYWEAATAGKLRTYAPRDKAIAAWLGLQYPATREKQEELQRAAWLNHRLHFQDLWNYVGYHHVFTVWNSVARDTPWAPRIKAVDREPPVPQVAQRFMHNNAGEMRIARASTEALLSRDDNGQWQKNPRVWDTLDTIIEATFVPDLRPYTLMVLSVDCPYYRNQFTPEEFSRDDTAYRLAEAVWPRHGIRSVLVGIGFSAEDYVDRRHISVSGGTKMAAQVAAAIRQMQPSPNHE
jgi:hypothetical protein